MVSSKMSDSHSAGKERTNKKRTNQKKQQKEDKVQQENQAMQEEQKEQQEQQKKSKIATQQEQEQEPEQKQEQKQETSTNSHPRAEMYSGTTQEMGATPSTDEGTILSTQEGALKAFISLTVIDESPHLRDAMCRALAQNPQAFSEEKKLNKLLRDMGARIRSKELVEGARVQYLQTVAQPQSNTREGSHSPIKSQTSTVRLSEREPLGLILSNSPSFPSKQLSVPSRGISSSGVDRSPHNTVDLDLENAVGYLAHPLTDAAEIRKCVQELLQEGFKPPFDLEKIQAKFVKYNVEKSHQTESCVLNLPSRDSISSGNRPRSCFNCGVKEENSRLYGCFSCGGVLRDAGLTHVDITGTTAWVVTPRKSLADDQGDSNHCVEWVNQQQELRDKEKERKEKEKEREKERGEERRKDEKDEKQKNQKEEEENGNKAKETQQRQEENKQGNTTESVEAQRIKKIMLLLQAEIKERELIYRLEEENSSLILVENLEKIEKSPDLILTHLHKFATLEGQQLAISALDEIVAKIGQIFNISTFATITDLDNERRLIEKTCFGVVWAKSHFISIVKESNNIQIIDDLSYLQHFTDYPKWKLDICKFFEKCCSKEESLNVSFINTRRQVNNNECAISCISRCLLLCGVSVCLSRVDFLSLEVLMDKILGATNDETPTKRPLFFSPLSTQRKPFEAKEKNEEERKQTGMDKEKDPKKEEKEEKEEKEDEEKEEKKKEKKEEQKEKKQENGGEKDGETGENEGRKSWEKGSEKGKFQFDFIEMGMPKLGELPSTLLPLNPLEMKTNEHTLLVYKCALKGPVDPNLLLLIEGSTEQRAYWRNKNVVIVSQISNNDNFILVESEKEGSTLTVKSEWEAIGVKCSELIPTHMSFSFNKNILNILPIFNSKQLEACQKENYVLPIRKVMEIGDSVFQEQTLFLKRYSVLGSHTSTLHEIQTICQHLDVIVIPGKGFIKIYSKNKIREEDLKACGANLWLKAEPRSKLNVKVPAKWYARITIPAKDVTFFKSAKTVEPKKDSVFGTEIFLEEKDWSEPVRKLFQLHTRRSETALQVGNTGISQDRFPHINETGVKNAKDTTTSVKNEREVAGIKETADVRAGKDEKPRISTKSNQRRKSESRKKADRQQSRNQTNEILMVAAVATTENQSIAGLVVSASEPQAPQQQAHRQKTSEQQAPQQWAHQQQQTSEQTSEQQSSQQQTHQHQTFMGYEYVSDEDEEPDEPTTPKNNWRLWNRRGSVFNLFSGRPPK